MRTDAGGSWPVALPATRRFCAKRKPLSIVGERTEAFKGETGGYTMENYRLIVGNSYDGTEYLDTDTLPNTDVFDMTQGIIYTTLFYTVDGVAQRIDRQMALPSTPYIEFPIPGSTFTSDTITFSMNSDGLQFDEWRLLVGTPSDDNAYHDTGVIPSPFADVVVSGLPVDGSTVTAKLFIRKDNAVNFDRPIQTQNYQATAQGELTFDPIDPVRGEGSIDYDQSQEGITLTGTGVDGRTITFTHSDGSVSIARTSATGGAWSSPFPSSEILKTSSGGRNLHVITADDGVNRVQQSYYLRSFLPTTTLTINNAYVKGTLLNVTTSSSSNGFPDYTHTIDIYDGTSLLSNTVLVSNSSTENQLINTQDNWPNTITVTARVQNVFRNGATFSQNVSTASGNITRVTAVAAVSSAQTTLVGHRSLPVGFFPNVTNASSVSELKSALRSAAPNTTVRYTGSDINGNQTFTGTGGTGWNANERVYLDLNDKTLKGNMTFRIPNLTVANGIFTKNVTPDGINQRYCYNQFIKRGQIHFDPNRNANRGHDTEIDNNYWHDRDASSCITLAYTKQTGYVNKRAWIHHNTFENVPTSDSHEVIWSKSWSEQITQDQWALVEYNRFHNCDGDPELISTKSPSWIIRFNLHTSAGRAHYTLRRGSNHWVYGNVTFGLKREAIRFPTTDSHGYFNYLEGRDNGSLRVYAVQKRDTPTTHAANQYDGTLNNTFRWNVIRGSSRWLQINRIHGSARFHAQPSDNTINENFFIDIDNPPPNYDDSSDRTSEAQWNRNNANSRRQDQHALTNAGGNAFDLAAAIPNPFVGFTVTDKWDAAHRGNPSADIFVEPGALFLSAITAT